MPFGQPDGGFHRSGLKTSINDHHLGVLKKAAILVEIAAGDVLHYADVVKSNRKRTVLVQDGYVRTGAIVAGDKHVVNIGSGIGRLGDELNEGICYGIGRGFARWQRSVCIGVHNMQATSAQYIVDRISGMAREIGLEVGGWWSG